MKPKCIPLCSFSFCCSILPFIAKSINFIFPVLISFSLGSFQRILEYLNGHSVSQMLRNFINTWPSSFVINISPKLIVLHKLTYVEEGRNPWHKVAKSHIDIFNLKESDYIFILYFELQRYFEWLSVGSFSFILIVEVHKQTLAFCSYLFFMIFHLHFNYLLI